MLTAIGLSDSGKTRDHNQDTLVFPGLISIGSLSVPLVSAYQDGPALFAVVDGMGGHRGGQEASRIVAQRLANQPIAAVELALESANRELHETSGYMPHLTGMGATVAGVSFADRQDCLVFNVGDARVYHWANGYLLLLTQDDRLRKDSQIVTQSLGATEHPIALDVHKRKLKFSKGERLLICSDGLSEALEFDTIQSLLTIESLEYAATELLTSALDAGAADNVSIVLIESET